MNKVMVYLLATALACGLTASWGYAQTQPAFTKGPTFLPPPIHDSGSNNFVKEGWSLQFFDNRNDSGGLPDWVVTSKGDYFLLDVQIKLGGSLGNFDDIIDVIAQHSEDPKVEFTMIRNTCNSIFGYPYKEFYLHVRYIPWMRMGTWTYTMRYYDGYGKVHIQSWENPGDGNLTNITPPINAVYFGNPPPPNEGMYVIVWYGIGLPSYSTQYRLRVYDEYGCLISELPRIWPYFYYDEPTNRVFFNVTSLRGKVVRAESRIYLPEYGATARSCYTVRVPY